LAGTDTNPSLGRGARYGYECSTELMGTLATARVETPRAVEWRTHLRWAVAIAVLSPIAYVLVLTALALAPVSHVAPAREVSIVIGAFLGAKYLKESDGRRRIWAAVAMAAGVIALALG